MAKFTGRHGMLYARVERIQGLNDSGSVPVIKRVYPKSPAACHMNGKSSKDIYLESRETVRSDKRELANAFRL